MGSQATSVALDVGPGSGALVIYPGEQFRGREIEISPAGANGSRTHTGVLDRHTGTDLVRTAVFGRLPAGDYVVWMDDSTPAHTVTVTEGMVTEISLNEARP